MSVHHEVLVRVFGPTAAFLAAHRGVFEKEISDPSYSFGYESFSLSMPEGYSGGVFRAQRNREAPMLGRLDCTSPPFAGEGLAFEVLHLIDDREYHSIYVGGQRVYNAQRQEETGGEYELGDPDQAYFYSFQEGSPAALLDVMDEAGVRHTLRAL